MFTAFWENLINWLQVTWKCKPKREIKVHILQYIYKYVCIVCVAVKIIAFITVWHLHFPNKFDIKLRTMYNTHIHIHAYHYLLYSPSHLLIAIALAKVKVDFDMFDSFNWLCMKGQLGICHCLIC